jgi:hypothetical protein
MKTLLFTFCIAFFLFSCNTIKVSTDYDKHVDFTKYKTFAFINLKVSDNISELNQDRIVEAIQFYMQKKGFVWDTLNPDMLVNATAIIKDKQYLSANTYGTGGYYRPYYGYGGTTTTVDVVEYKEGSLIIDIVDNKTQKLIWEGIGNEEIDAPSKDPERDINYAVYRILLGFPPEPKK